MSKDNKIAPFINIQNYIFTIRGMEVMLDSDLAEMYGIENKRLNEQVKRNIDRFPDRFRFQLTNEERAELVANCDRFDKSLRSQNATLNNRGQHSKYLPYAFTEQGISMLSAVLRSETAVKVSIRIIDAFVEMRKFITANANIFQRLDKVDLKQLETDQKIEQIFKAIEDKSITSKQGIFFDGQIFDAYTLACDIIKQATKSIILIDNYIDETVLTLLSKRNKNVVASIYTKPSKQIKLDIDKHNKQYPPIQIKSLTKTHDRFIILDQKVVYHLGASLKDLGKKWFAFSKMEMDAKEILKRLEN